MNIFYKIEGILVAFIGRPILWLIKQMRWIFLIAGIYFNSISTYAPIQKQITSTKFTIIPFIVGFILFCIGLTVKRYDVAYKECIEIIEKT